MVAGSEFVLSPRTTGVSSSADLVWDGTQYFVAFSKQPAGASGSGQLTAVARVSASGQPGAIRVVTCAGPGNDFFPRVTWNGVVHAIAYTRQYAPSGTTLQEGRVLLLP